MTSSISIRRLDGGLMMIVEPISGVRSLGLCWLLPAGAARDPAGKIGLSALWSEMLCRGAGELDSRAQADAFDRLGVSRSAGTGTFVHTVSATMLGARLGEALPLIVDMVRRPRFDEADLEPSRDLCLQGLESLADDPQDRLMVDLRGHHAPSPINRSVYGEEAGLRAVTIGDVRDGWRERAVPGGSILALAGDVDPEQAADLVSTLIEGWSGESADVAVGEANGRGAYHHRADETNQCHIALAWDSPREADDNAWLERVATAVLSGGMSGRLFTEVREKRALCYSVSASYGADKDYGRSIAYSGTTPERAQETLDVLRQELERINTPEGKVTQDEFERATVGMKSRLVMSGESTGARASALATDWRKLGRARSLDDLAAQVDAVTQDGVNEYLSGRTMGEVTVCTVGPGELVVGESSKAAH